MSANEYNAGDLVEAVKGETVIRGRVKADDLGLHLWVGDSGRTPENIESYGFTLRIIERAAPVVVLPAEPGAYVNNRGSVFVLNDDGDWLDFSLWRGGVNNLAAANPDYHPFTHLAPISETAKKVLDRVRDSVGSVAMHPDERSVLNGDFSRICREFGVEL